MREDLKRLSSTLSNVKNPLGGNPTKKSPITGDIKIKKDPFSKKEKTSLSLSSSKIPTGFGKVSFGLGINKVDKKGYNTSFNPSAKVKLNIDINKLHKKQQKKKQTPKFDF